MRQIDIILGCLRVTAAISVIYFLFLAARTFQATADAPYGMVGEIQAVAWLQVGYALGSGLFLWWMAVLVELLARIAGWRPEGEEEGTWAKRPQPKDAGAWARGDKNAG